MSVQAEEEVLKRRLMEEVPQEPITADPREDEEDENVAEEEDEERGGQARRIGQRAELGAEAGRARAGRRRGAGRPSLAPPELTLTHRRDHGYST